ncbi:cobyric acid synthase [Roseospira visakhapatnamensis]|uniref:Cobyric acid synthase n=1 Tax=Roseospira visakhapatnamensis TaxID=390880 RepID=A0A7W6REP2_9PROT|nr:cobyric acid synthase [Roseospira visakhapatnamensis]MBB4266922.1 adenosylcobyric acid synthase [Roseospira visakhapatnamensis]
MTLEDLRGRRPAAALMLQGTGSDVGKSLLVAGLARALTRRGLTVRPFKPQNMSNNAAVTREGGEIGRAQALQARACGVAPSVHMNPVLLKPQTDVGSQVVVQGRVRGNAGARDYQGLKPTLLPAVLDSFARLRAEADIVVVEGAGSASEVNLRAGDIANMGFAVATGTPVVLVGDIDRGGVIGSLVGTWALLPAEDRALLKGYVINKFRGDPSLFTPAVDILRDRTGLPCLGIVPWVARAADLPAEDAVALERPATAGPAAERPVKVGVLRLSRIANFDDLDPLSAEPDVSLTFVAPGRALPGDLDLVILPGSKATLADLAFLRTQGWDIDLMAHWRRGGAVLGLCAGYQMLGRVVRDPEGIEGPPGEAPGLGLLDVETTIGRRKTLREGPLGYEMHMGVTEGPDTGRPWPAGPAGLAAVGAASHDGRVLGCYLHGLLHRDETRRALLALLRPGRAEGSAFEARVESALDALADTVAGVVDLDALARIARTATPDT